MNIVELKKIKKTLLRVFFFSVAFLSLWTYGTHFSIKSSVDKHIVFPGDEIELSVKIEFHTNLKVRKPGPGTVFGPFEVKDYKIHEPYIKNGVVYDRIDYTLIIFDTGNHIIPPAEAVAFINGSPVTIQTDPVKIHVKNITPEKKAEETLKPAKKNTLPQGFIPKRYIIAFACILMLLILGPVLLLIRKKLLKKEPQAIPPWTRFIQEHDNIKKRGLLNKKNYKIFYYDLTAAFREFLEAVYGIKCTTLTTQPIIEAFKNSPITREYQESREKFQIEIPDVLKLSEFLTYADKIKFADIKADPQKATEHLTYTLNTVWKVRKSVNSQKESKQT